MESQFCRTRLLAAGTFNQETCKFTELTEMHANQGSFDKSGDDTSAPSLYGEYSTISGTKVDGFKTHSYRCQCSGQNCNFGSTLAGSVEVDSANSSTSCFPATAACTGNDGLTLDPSADLGYLAIGASWDINGSTRSAFQNWLKDAVPL